MNQRATGPIGLLLGVVLLGAVAAFGIALPKATGDHEAETGGTSEPGGTGAIELPDELPHGLVAQDQLDGEAAGRYAAAQQSAVEGFAEIYDESVGVRGYANDDGRIQATVTVLDRAPGLFDPNGPPIDPEVLGLARSVYELRRVGDAVCNLNFQQVVPQGQPVDDSAAPASLQCQQGDGDRTIELFGSGLTLDQAVDVLRELAHDQ
jgi:hypothetical protein